MAKRKSRARAVKTSDFKLIAASRCGLALSTIQARYFGSTAIFLSLNEASLQRLQMSFPIGLGLLTTKGKVGLCVLVLI